MNLTHIRWKLADILSKWACKLRGNRWYLGDTFARVSGNRAAELAQSIWERCVVLHVTSGSKDKEWIDTIEKEIAELGQLAGENCGHLK